MWLAQSSANESFVDEAYILSVHFSDTLVVPITPRTGCFENPIHKVEMWLKRPLLNPPHGVINARNHCRCAFIIVVTQLVIQTPITHPIDRAPILEYTLKACQLGTESVESPGFCMG